MAIGTQTQLYPSDMTNTSNSFKLEDDISVIKILGMSPGDSAFVEVNVGTGECDNVWVPYIPCATGQLEFSYPRNEFYLTVPNKYRLVLSNEAGLHNIDPSHFEDVRILQAPVESEALVNSRCCDENCDVYVIAAIPSGTGGWTLIRNDGETIDVDLISSDNSIIINGNDIIVNSDIVCETLASFTVLSTPLGG